MFIKLEQQNYRAFALYHLLPNQLFNLINESTNGVKPFS